MDQSFAGVVTPSMTSINEPTARTESRDCGRWGVEVSRGAEIRLSLVEHVTLTPVNVQCADCETLAGHRR
jgi:hypothetical protein